MRSSHVPVVDLFAGPGGLGEGFSAFSKKAVPDFRLAISVEKDATAHATLLLRSFKRQFGRTPELYYDRLRGSIDSEELYRAFPAQAEAARLEATHLELGPSTRQAVDGLIERALKREPESWVLVGGPPCQAYSLVGRSKMRGEDPDAYARDPRHFLYREYLRILRRFKPPVFVLENVKGLLSSTIRGRETIREIVRDLHSAGYTLHSFTRPGTIDKDFGPEDFVIRAEDYGIPQARHRVIILGLRQGLERGRSILQPQLRGPTIEDAIRDLPRIRSCISGMSEDFARWKRIVQATARTSIPRHLRPIAEKHLDAGFPESLGAEFMEARRNGRNPSEWLSSKADWYLDERIGGVIHHAARGHMESDIQRYLFAAVHAAESGTSPKLADFPKALLPSHRNIIAAVKGEMFSDRFRVQRRLQASTTIVSHISKDGHYYIHYDPAQCRSLTVREAARLQTFPDNYFFEGGRTAQYHQVGNAVPPLLAREMAAVVSDIASQLRSRTAVRSIDAVAELEAR